MKADDVLCRLRAIKDACLVAGIDLDPLTATALLVLGVRTSLFLGKCPAEIVALTENLASDDGRPRLFS
jgi:hypothetical protein